MTRPALKIKVEAADGSYFVEFFLVDSCADRTVFSADLLSKLSFPTNASPGSSALQGVGGMSGIVLVRTVLELTRDDGGPVHLRGEFAAFTDPAATDLSILGRDVLNNFDVIFSRQRNEVLLLAPNHQYRVERV
ncbi:MAG: retropepsin-like domain-containing protein [Planctomycetes bacterium]|nr:retropepsin-like domain-containing protein [Planctomycetota bacterium]